MRFNKLGAFLGAMALAATVMVTEARASDTNLIGLTANNALTFFNSATPNSVRRVVVTGLNGTLIGVDVRPANGLLYGITSTNYIYTINPNGGVATFVSILNTDFNGGQQSGVDFNPAADRLRLVGRNDQNFRVNVDTGEVSVDTPIIYPTTDIGTGNNPKITAIAYINSVTGATTTKLFDIDYGLDVLTIQNPPNDGALMTVGPLGVDFGPTGGFEIFIDDNGVNSAFAVSGSVLYAIDLVTGKAISQGTIGDGNYNLLGLTSAP